MTESTEAEVPQLAAPGVKIALQVPDNTVWLLIDVQTDRVLQVMAQRPLAERITRHEVLAQWSEKLPEGLSVDAKPIQTWPWRWISGRLEHYPEDKNSNLLDYNRNELTAQLETKVAKMRSGAGPKDHHESLLWGQLVAEARVQKGPLIEGLAMSRSKSVEDTADWFLKRDDIYRNIVASTQDYLWKFRGELEAAKDLETLELLRARIALL